MVQLKLNATLAGAIATVGVSAMTKLWEGIGPKGLGTLGRSTGVLGEPVTALVAGLVL